MKEFSRGSGAMTLYWSFNGRQKISLLIRRASSKVLLASGLRIKYVISW